MISARRRRSARREAYRALAKLVGDEEADQLLFIANKTRREHNLCLCADSVDVRVYGSAEEAEAAKSAPAPICAGCGKERLRLAVVAEGKEKLDA